MQNNQELYHYGVLGMKWGVRRARRKEAKANYRKATDKAFAEYERTIGRIEKSYKRGQNLSDKDLARESAAEAKYQKTVANAKAKYKQDRKSHANDANIANRLYSKQSKAANKRVTDMSTTDAVVQSFLMGSYGALKFNEAKSRGASTGRAAVEGVLFNFGNTQLGGLPSAYKYLDNRFARKRR